MTRKSSYLIEFRFQGKAKKRIKQMIREINSKCRIRPPHRPVPHITLAGSFSTKNELCPKRGSSGSYVSLKV